MASEFGDTEPSPSLPDLNIDTCTSALQSQSGTSGLPPQGLQGWALVRDGDPPELSLPQLVSDQPGVLEGSEVYWAYDEGRKCIIVSSSKVGALAALRTDVAGEINTRDPSAHKQYILASSTLTIDATGRLRTAIPSQMQPDYDPFAQTGVDVPQELRADGPPLPDIDAGMLFAVVAEHVPASEGRNTAFALRSLIDFAESLTPQRLRGSNSRYPWATPIVTRQWEQAHLLSSLPMIDNAQDDRLYVVGADENHPVRKRIELQYDSTEANLADRTVEILCHGRELSATELRAVLKRLTQVGGLALALPP